MKLLLVEDEEALRQELKSALNTARYSVEEAPDGEEGLYLGTEYEFDAAIIDLGLPKLNGIELIKKLREKSKTFPILILTARDHWQDKVDGLAAGADDYLVKPFYIQELLARINALLRRSSGLSTSTLSIGPLSLDTFQQVVKLNDSEIELTAYEYKVLEYLLVNQGKVVSKSELTEHIYEQDHDKDSNVIEVFVGRLRRKIDPDGTYKFVETLRGRGYRIKPED
ncbi:MAG: response regulator transcription factor [Pseudomonadota bacterium]